MLLLHTKAKAVDPGARGVVAPRVAACLFAILFSAAFHVSFAAGKERPYPHGKYEEDCSLCHRADRWSPAGISDRFDHARSGFVLDGAHASTTCRSCHATLRFEESNKACLSCHLDVHQGELGADCARCHTTSSFVDRADEVRAHGLTRFPLSGAHSTADCASCHPSTPQGGLRFVNTPVECASCHQQDYEGAKEPDHVVLGFGQDCAACHSVVAWNRGGGSLGSGFDHAATGFPLSGAHRAASCTQCHAGNRFAGTSPECASCHQQDYQATTRPNHAAQAFPTDCRQCHTSNGWSPATFDHGTTGFALTGAHGSVDCQSCHGGQPAAITPECSSCHRDDYQQAPNHVTSNFPLTCEQCHGTTTWLDATFDHPSFPLTGGHNGVTCIQCHTTGTFAAMPTDCLFCHQADYVAAPSHVTSNFPQTCEQCHRVTTWSDATFAHDSFPLTAGHSGLTCVACHTTGSYGAIPADCVSCHLTDYQQAPGHVGNFPQTCEQCHGTTTWLDATFNHQFFPLTGGHNGLTCVACHATGTYGTIPSDCVSCHRDDYQRAADHANLQLSTDCDSCHTINAWLTLTFFHPWPLVGHHESPSQIACSECHISNTTTNFSCEGACHQHTAARMLDKHSGVRDYVFDFPACVSCHANGRG